MLSAQWRTSVLYAASSLPLALAVRCSGLGTCRRPNIDHVHSWCIRNVSVTQHSLSPRIELAELLHRGALRVSKALGVTAASPAGMHARSNTAAVLPPAVLRLRQHEQPGGRWVASQCWQRHRARQWPWYARQLQRTLTSRSAAVLTLTRAPHSNRFEKRKNFRTITLPQQRKLKVPTASCS